MPYGTRSTGPVVAARTDRSTNRNSASSGASARTPSHNRHAPAAAWRRGSSQQARDSAIGGSNLSSSAHHGRRSVLGANGAAGRVVSSAGSAESRQRGEQLPAASGRTREDPAPTRSGKVNARTLKMMKRMRPEELRELSKMAAELEKDKIEAEKKVSEFVANTPDFVELVDDCYICLEPLLHNLGTPKFGVMSWNCRCTVAQKAHSSCVFSKICRGKDSCDMCSSPMLFENPRGKCSEATIRFFKRRRRISPAEQQDEQEPTQEGEDEEDEEDEEEDVDEQEESASSGGEEESDSDGESNSNSESGVERSSQSGSESEDNGAYV